MSRQNRFVIVIAALAFMVGAAFFTSQPRPLEAPPVEFAAVEGLSPDQLGQWCQDRKAQGTAGLSSRAKAWLNDCIALFGGASTPSPTVSATQSPSPSPSPTASPTPTVAPTTTTAAPTTPPASPTPSPSTSTPAGSWPDASNTGPTPDLAPRPCSGAITLGTGAVLQNVAITGGCDINVTGPGVVIRNISMAVSNNDGWAIIVRNGASATITDVEVFGLDKTTRSVQYAILAQPDANVTITRADLHHCADCVQGEHVVLTDSYIHDLANIEGVSHVDGFQCNGGCQGTVIRHNRIHVEYAQTGAVALFQDFGVPSNVVVDNNWLSGGGFTIYGGGGNASSRKGTPTNIRITNNVVTPGAYGWLTEWNGSGAGNVLSGNRTPTGVALG